jgi:uncharacterized damage-inducible protein DinB
MSPNDVLVLNLEEVRRRSLLVWRGIPVDRLTWAPDREAMSCIGVVRHVLEGEFLYAEMLKAGRSVSESISPYLQRPLSSVEEELAFAAPYRAGLIRFVRSLTPDKFGALRIDRSDKGYVRPAGDFILRMAYHEAVHTGQLLAYLRQMGVSRPSIWD